MSEAHRGFARPESQPAWWQAGFLEREADETAARVAMAIDSPWVLPVLSASPVVYGGPLDGARPDAPLSVADAVECLLQLCDVLAHAHAEGWVGLGVDLHDVRVLPDGDAWRVSVVLPHLPPRGRFSYAHLWCHNRPPAQRDLCAAVALMADLITGDAPEPLTMWGSTRDYEQRPMPSLGATHAAVASQLAALLAASSEPSPIEDAASLAALVRPLARDPDAWRARIDAMARARPTSLRRDWDRLVALGEAELAERPRDLYAVYPLAAAWHQRACAAFARGDLAAAMRDVARSLALDPWCRYLVTRGSIRDAAGDARGALEDFDAAIDAVRLHGPWRDEDDDLMIDRRWLDDEGAAEAMRALYARGVLRLRRGDVDGAYGDLLEAKALSFEASPAFERDREPAFATRLAGAMAAVLRRRVAAGHEAERAKLALALHDAGRTDEGLVEARAVAAQRPGDARLMARLKRRFGAALHAP